LAFLLGGGGGRGVFLRGFLLVCLRGTVAHGFDMVR
jgi:hypothetical protein